MRIVCPNPRHTLQWHHNESDSVSNHQRLDCFVNRLLRHRSNKISKLRVTNLCEGSPVDSPHKGPVTRKLFPFDHVIMYVLRTGTLRSYVRSGIVTTTQPPHVFWHDKRLSCYEDQTVKPLICWTHPPVELALLMNHHANWFNSRRLSEIHRHECKFTAFCDHSCDNISIQRSARRANPETITLPACFTTSEILTGKNWRFLKGLV